MHVSQIATLSNKECRTLVEVGRQLALKRIHGEYVDPIHFTEVVNAMGDAYRQVLEIEKTKIKLQQHRDDAARAVAAAEKPKARREAKLATAKQRIAELQRELEKAQAAAVAIAKEDAEIIDRPQKLQGAADGTARLLSNLEGSMWRILLHAEWTAPAELFEEGATA